MKAEITEYRPDVYAAKDLPHGTVIKFYNTGSCYTVFHKGKDVYLVSNDTFEPYNVGKQTTDSFKIISGFDSSSPKEITWDQIRTRAPSPYSVCLFGEKSKPQVGARASMYDGRHACKNFLGWLTFR